MTTQVAPLPKALAPWRGGRAALVGVGAAVGCADGVLASHDSPRAGSDSFPLIRLPDRYRSAADGVRRATVVGAGSFGTAVAVLLERAGVRTTLLCRTEAQTRALCEGHQNDRYLDGVALPHDLKIRTLGSRDDPFARPDLLFLAVPSPGLAEAIVELGAVGVSDRTGLVSLAKGLVAPQGNVPTVELERAFGPERVACVGGPAHAREMVESGAGLVCASHSEVLAHLVADTFQRSGVVCEVSDDPVGAELAAVAKNAAAVAVGATQAQGVNAAGMAAADIFLEVLSLAERSGGRPGTFVGRAGTGDLVATALAPSSRNRSAGELLAAGVPASQIPARLGHAVEALETVRLLARAIERRGLEAPVTSALARLIDGGLPLERWIELVRAKQPAPAPFGATPRERVKRWLRRRQQRHKQPRIDS